MPRRAVALGSGRRSFGMRMTAIQSGLKRWIDRDQLSPSFAEAPRVFVRVGMGVAAAVGTGGLAAIALLVGVSLTTGCFFSCDDPNPLAGIPFLGATAALTTLSLAALWWGFVDRHWRLVLKTLGIAGSIEAVVLVVATLASA